MKLQYDEVFSGHQNQYVVVVMYIIQKECHYFNSDLFWTIYMHC